MKSKSTAVMILAGGKATRLGAICQDTPKSMLMVGKYPFLAYLVVGYLRYGLEPIVILAGYLGEVITRYFSHKPWENKPIHVHHLVSDDGTYGTGARLIRDAKIVNTDNILLLNGDTVTDFSIQELMEQHQSSKSSCTVVLTRLFKVPNHGAFLVGKQNKILASLEMDILGRNQLPDPTKVIWRGSSTGAILFRREALLDMPLTIGQSLERQLLPSLIAQGQVMAFDNGTRLFFDFGYPDKLMYLQEHAEEVIKIYGSPKMSAEEISI